MRRRAVGRAWVRACLAAALVACALSPSPVAGQTKRLTLDDIYDPVRRVDAAGTLLDELSWKDDTTYVWARRLDDDAVEWMKGEVDRGTASTLFDVAALEAALRSLPGLTSDEITRAARSRSLVFDREKRRAVLSLADDLFGYVIDSRRLVRLTSDPGEERDPSFSPDGRFVAFTRDHDLRVVEFETQRERQLTTDGSDVLLNGRLDWVYQEEIYGRGTFRGFWWSPDSTRLAFLQLNEAAVAEVTLVDHLPYRQRVEVFHYPKAGDPNPAVRLGVVAAAGGPITWIDTARYPAHDHLIVRVAWHPDSHEVTFQVQDREQTWLDLNVADAGSGSARTLLHETTPAWVEPHGHPGWLKDRTFLWLSERDGWRHLYHYAQDGTLIHRVTAGPWEVRELAGVDQASGWVYFTGTERSTIGVDVYRVKLDGTAFTRLSQAAGTHTASFNPSFTHYVGTWSDVVTPTQTRLHRADGREVRLLEANPVTALKDFQLSTPEFLQVRTRDGFVMEALMIKPSDFDPSRRYPVYQHTYGGPHAPQVRNAWGASTFLFHQLLAQHGIVVWICDNRTASGKGAVSAWPAYKRLGETELADIEDGLAWLAQQKWVDAARVGINGWSYGGFLVSYALTHSTRFAMGIAGGPVTDWRDYDTIYTERYMLTPQRNPEGYERSAPRLAAKNLHGRLLLLHGTMDDNVHVQNTLQFIHALQKAGKHFEMMLYPGERHALADRTQVEHLRGLMLDFILRTLGPDAAPATTGTASDVR
jgi:dipeptidyl-peptidase-4